MKRPFYIEIPYGDPAILFAPHANTPFAQLLDSAMFDIEQGRYSFIAIDPFETFTHDQNSFAELKEKLASYSFERHPNLPPFQGGVVGYFGYELLHQIERIPSQAKDDLSVPDICLGFYDVIAAFDHHLKQAWIFSLFNEDRAYWLKSQLLENCLPLPTFKPCSLDWKSGFQKDEYIAAVQSVIDYIHAGDIFQANLTQRFKGERPDDIDPFAFYLNLRKINPALFSAYLNFGDFCIASSSPERFLKREGRQVETRPIKGTRARHPDAAQDQAHATELANSEKDRAENTMIVDLLRNDLSRVCKPHSVHVPELCAVHSFASVHHLVSTITGELENTYDGIDLLCAAFPGGSITGAPKVRAMEIISELERCPRGVYCGAIGYIGFDGSMDTNIVIRTVLFKDKTVCIQVGGGIVADSSPHDEYEETLTKAKALFDAFARQG
ncbi:aminodeoxychorismate synthase component I [Terasakiella sp.]|uniref:aminodeoxychorismate synthase component I n=1 Tax=Terasakiella sp. TaxID=2034861 RepID=UPI003AA84F9A